MAGDIKVTVQTQDGNEKEIETPPDIKVEEFTKELVIALSLTMTDADGRPIVWRLDDKDTGKSLDAAKTLDEEGVRDGHRLSLIRATVAGYE